MAELTPSQKQVLIQREKQLGVAKLVEYIGRYSNLTLADFPNMADVKRQEIERLLPKIPTPPNPDEQRDWAQIQGEVSEPMLINRLNDYLTKWKDVAPVDNHLAEAKQRLAGIEEQNWQCLDTLSVSAVYSFLERFPQTTHRETLDDTVWQLSQREPEAWRRYLQYFPLGRHATEARNLLQEWEDARNDWAGVAASPDNDSETIFSVYDYCANHLNSPFIEEAHRRLEQLKQIELQGFSDGKSDSDSMYNINRAKRLIQSGIIPLDTFISCDLLTENIYHTSCDGGLITALNNMATDAAVRVIDPTSREGYTDVYFFGVPSTGKTCVLMGLSRARRELDINPASNGGNYIECLQQHTDAGKVMDRTPGNFISLIEATSSEPGQSGRSKVHKLSLIEMAGEDFAYNIVRNTQIDRDKFSFEDMGTGATKLLQNGNRKVFFLIIDPTRLKMPIKREYQDEEGNVRKEYGILDQRDVLNTLVNIFDKPANAEIMRHVDSIHFIITKADTLGSGDEAKSAALEIFNRDYRDSVRTLFSVCEKFNINSSNTNKYRPNLYTYSLGKFYLGGFFEYDPTDAEVLVRAIRGATRAEKPESIWDKIKGFVN